ADDTDQAERFVETLGGKVIKELELIHSFAALVPSKAVPQLANLAAVNWVSLDAPMVSAVKPGTEPDPTVGYLPNYYIDTLGVRQVWEMGLRGEGVGVAVIDSGIFMDRDFSEIPGKPQMRIDKAVSFNGDTTTDIYGHGTHVAGIVGGNGTASGEFYSGIAPKVNFINLKISDEYGMAYESDTVEALKWALDNKEAYNIRVVNLSINSTVESSYNESPIDVALEILWFNGIVVVASSGNKGPDGGYNTVNAAPANDPFVITVGSSDEHGTSDRADDSIAPFSSLGTTSDGFIKPEINAPGVNIISVLASASDWEAMAPDRVLVDGEYFRISGTSMAAPMVTGAVALLLQSEPDLTPDQVKYRLTHATGWLDGTPYLDVFSLITTPTTESANQGIKPHDLLAKMAMIAYWASAEGEENIDWDAVNWNAVNWNAVNWNAVNWNAVNWNAVNWNAVNWNAVNWNAVNWNAVNWNAVNWNSVNWNAVNWNSVTWSE
ncbi:MAG: S8 family serine peptidase, partial [Anaerolineales bacterium]|nr:S8 family serine peptidase [Anaerolineales bacterium]